jgi:hypothetical protein
MMTIQSMSNFFPAKKAATRFFNQATRRNLQQRQAAASVLFLQRNALQTKSIPSTGYITEGKT